MTTRLLSLAILSMLAACPREAPGPAADAGAAAPTGDAGSQEPVFGHGEGLHCEPGDEEDRCGPLGLVCSQVLGGAHEHWACAREGAAMVPIAARTKAVFRPPGQGAQEETRLEIKLQGSDQILSAAELSIVKEPKGHVEIRDDGIFYRPDDQPDSVTSPFEEGPTVGSVAYYDTFSFRIEGSQEILAIVELSPPTERGGHAQNVAHPWEVVADTGRFGLTLGGHSSLNGSLTARRIWPECWTIKEVSSPMQCGGGQVAIGAGLSLGLTFEVDRAQLRLLRGHANLDGCGNWPLFSIKNIGITAAIFSVSYCFVNVIPEYGDGFGGSGYCGDVGGLGLAVGGGGISCFPSALVGAEGCFHVEGLSEDYGYACGPFDDNSENCENDCDCGAYGSDAFCGIVGPRGGFCSPCVGHGCNRCDGEGGGGGGIGNCQNDGDCPDGQWCNDGNCEDLSGGMCRNDGDCAEPGLPCCMAGVCQPIPNGMNNCQ